MNRRCSKEDIQVVSKHIKRYLTRFFIREVHITTTVLYHLTPIRMARIFFKCFGEDEKKSELPYTAVDDAKWGIA